MLDRCAVTFIALQPGTNEWHLRVEVELMVDSILNKVAIGVRSSDLGVANMR